MDDWLKTHVALLMPSLCPALYAAGTDNYRLARTRDGLVLTIRAIREGFQMLRALGVTITPANMKIVEWIPEPILIILLRRLITVDAMKVALVGHANAARDEMQHLTDEFLALTGITSVPTPAIDELYPYLDPNTPLMPEGSRQIPLKWGGMLVGLCGLTVGLMGLIFIVKTIGLSRTGSR